MSPPTSVSHTWSQVSVAFLLVIVDWAILDVLRLGVGASLVVSALRCGTQLIVVTFVLRCVFNVESMWAVARLARRFLQYCCKSECHTDGYQYFWMHFIVLRSSVRCGHILEIAREITVPEFPLYGCRTISRDPRLCD